MQNRRTAFCMNFFVVANKAALSCRRHKKADTIEALQHSWKFHQNNVFIYTPRNTLIWGFLSTKGRLFLFRLLLNRHVMMSLCIWPTWGIFNGESREPQVCGNVCNVCFGANYAKLTWLFPFRSGEFFHFSHKNAYKQSKPNCLQIQIWCLLLMESGRNSGPSWIHTVLSRLMSQSTKI